MIFPLKVVDVLLRSIGGKVEGRVDKFFFPYHKTVRLTGSIWVFQHFEIVLCRVLERHMRRVRYTVFQFQVDGSIHPQHEPGSVGDVKTRFGELILVLISLVESKLVRSLIPDRGQNSFHFIRRKRCPRQGLGMEKGILPGRGTRIVILALKECFGRWRRAKHKRLCGIASGKNGRVPYKMTRF